MGLAKALIYPPVTVITATWQRDRLLFDRCIPSVDFQDYPGVVKHLIVSDGPNPSHPPAGKWQHQNTRRPRCFMALDEHTDGHWGALPRRRACEVVDTPLVAYLDDDNAFLSNHLSVLAEALLAEKVDFVYSQMTRYYGGGETDIIGALPPIGGHVDTNIIMHRRELLEVATWQSAGYGSDADLVLRWVAGGASYSHVARPTVDYFMR